MEGITKGYETGNEELWSQLNDEWKLVKTHEWISCKNRGQLKKAYMLRNQIKWGANYTFAELIQLENLFINTLKANDVSNPMQKDAIKKACKMSVA